MIIAAVCAAVVLSVLFILMRSRVPNLRIFFNLSLAFFMFLIVFLTLWTLCAYDRCSRVAVIIMRVYIICFTAGIAFFFTMLGLIMSDAKTEEAEVDCVIVLGAGLRNDVPSYILRLRLNAADAYMRARDGTPVIVAGGLGEGETITEAQAMANYLIKRGVDENLIWKEDMSTRTRENIEFSLDIMREKGMDVENATVAIVTNEFHVYRAKLIAEKAGVEAVGVAAQTPGLYLRVLYFCREAFALASEIVF